jgi:hypothetical protein
MPNRTTVSGEVERPIENLVDMLIQAAREREAASRLPDCIAGADRRLTGAKEKLLQSLRVEPPSDVAGLVERLDQLRVILKSGDYNGADLMRAWCAMMDAKDTIVSLQLQIAERDKVLREARSFITERGKLDLDWDAVAETSDILAKLSTLIGNEGVPE